MKVDCVGPTPDEKGRNYYSFKREDGLWCVIYEMDARSPEEALSFAEIEFARVDRAAGSRMAPVFGIGQSVVVSSPHIEPWLMPSKWRVTAMNTDAETVTLTRSAHE